MHCFSINDQKILQTVCMVLQYGAHEQGLAMFIVSLEETPVTV